MAKRRNVLRSPHEVGLEEGRRWARRYEGSGRFTDDDLSEAVYEYTGKHLPTMLGATPRIAPYVTTREHLDKFLAGLHQGIEEDWRARRGNPHPASRGRKDMAARTKFFKEHADAVVGKHMVGALALAKAERLLEHAVERGVAEIRWEYEEFPDTSWMNAKQTKEYRDGHLEMLECSLIVAGDTEASLGGIALYPNADGKAQRRVIEAELAIEATGRLTEVLRSTRGHRSNTGASTPSARPERERTSGGLWAAIKDFIG